MALDANGRSLDGTERAELRDAKLQQEIGSVLLSARAVGKQMIARAQARSDEILKAAQEQADSIVREAEEKAAAIVREAEKQAACTPNAADRRTACANTAPQEQAAEYAVRSVEECFSRLRQQQLDNLEMLNAQWQGFLCGLMPEENAAPMQADAKEE